MDHISRRDLELLLLGLGAEGELSIDAGVIGITRLQKLLFLLEVECNLAPNKDGFEFTAYKAGPYSAKLYDDLEFLENLGLIGSEVTAEATEAEIAEIELSFEELINDGNGADGADAYEERRYFLTDTGLVHIQQLVEKEAYKPVEEGIRQIKSKYAKHSLSDLLYYVYSRYPQMTVESEIKDKVLRRKNKK